MPHVKGLHERRAMALLEQIVQMDRDDRDALPGSAVSHVKSALIILKKRRKHDQASRNSKSREKY